jgi:hypothetical protein
VNLRADCVVLAGAFFLPPDLKLEKVGVTRHDVATIVARAPPANGGWEYGCGEG